jgi:hypothetical protein
LREISSQPISRLRPCSPTFCGGSNFPPWWQAPKGLAKKLAPTFHLVDTLTHMHLVASGKPAAVVPVEYQRVKMTLYKGEDALAARRKVASKLTHRMLTALQRKRNVNDEPDWAPMQQLFDAGLSYDPFSGMPVFDPRTCAPALLKALWRGFCGVADTINTKQMGQTDEALDELQMRLHEHAAQITEQKQRRRAGALAKRSRASSPAASSSGEGTDTGAPARRKRTIRPMSDDDASATSVLRFSGSDDTTDHQLDRTDFIGSCSQCGGPEGHCVTCGTCFCAWCGPLVCKPCVSPATSPLLGSKCKPDAPLPPPSPPPSPPAQSQQLATLRGRSTTSALDRFMEDVRVDAAGKRGKRSGAASSSHAAKVAKHALLEDDEAGDTPDSPSAARHGMDGALACRRLLHACNATKRWRPAARSDTDWAAEELEWAARGARPMLRACDAADPPAAVLTFAGDDPPLRAVAPSCLQPNATPCCVSPFGARATCCTPYCVSPLGARTTCCGCTSDSYSESEDAESDDEERDDAASAAGFKAWQSEADARVLQLIIDGVERMQADASLDSHQRALGVLQHVAHGVPDVFGSKSAYECWRHLLYADGLDENSESEGSESDDDSPLPSPRPPPVSQLPPAPLPLSEEPCCQKHGCKGCTPSWPKAARRATPPFQIFYRDIDGHHGTLDGVRSGDLASAVLTRIAAKLGLSEATTSQMRLVHAGKQLDLTVACGLAKGETVHVLGRIEGGTKFDAVTFIDGWDYVNFIDGLLKNEPAYHAPPPHKTESSAGQHTRGTPPHCSEVDEIISACARKAFQCGGQTKCASIELFNACAEGRLEGQLGVKQLLAVQPPDELVPIESEPGDEYETTALCGAIVAGQLEAMRLLLAHGADPNLADSDGMTPLMVAASCGRGSAVKELMARGAYLNTRHPRGSTAFHEACIHNKPKCAALLVKLGCNRTLQTNNGRTGEQLASRRVCAAVALASKAEVTKSSAPPFQIFYRDLDGKHGTLDGVCGDDTASAVLTRIAAKLGLRPAVASGQLRLLKAGKQLELTAACGLVKGDTVHVVGGLDGGLRLREVPQFAGDGQTDTMSMDEDAMSIDLTAEAEVTPVDGPRMSIGGDTATPIDGAAMDKALSAMCRDMTALAHGKLCIAGSYALHRHLCEQGQFERARWKPTDIDIFYCSSGSGLDGDELRHRLSLLASRCLLQMLGVAGDLGDVHECQSSYDTVPVPEHVRRLLKYDDEDEARVAAFAREQLMSLCSSVPARSRQCARPALAPDPWAPLGWCSAAMLIASPLASISAGIAFAQASSSCITPRATAGLPCSTSWTWNRTPLRSMASWRTHCCTGALPPRPSPTSSFASSTLFLVKWRTLVVTTRGWSRS